MLDANLKTQLQAYLERLTRPVHLVASLDDGASSQEMLSLLQDIEALSPKVSLEVVRDDDQRKPSFAITSPGQDIDLRFAGLPMGHEFTSLVLALLQVGGHPSKAAVEVLEQVRGLPQVEGGGRDFCGSFVGTSFTFSDRAVLTTLEGDPRFFLDGRLGDCEMPERGNDGCRGK